MGRIIVIGGGLAGLSAAHWAAAAGHQVSVLEATGAFGGHSQTARADGLLLELGEGAFADTPGTLPGLAAGLGLSPQAAPEVERAVRRGGRTWVLPAGLDFLAGQGLGHLGQMDFGRGVRWRLGAERFAGAGPLKEELLGDFAQRRLGPEVWEALEPQLSAELGGPAGEASTGVVAPRLLALERQGGLVAGSREGGPGGRLRLAGGMGSLVEALGRGLLERGAALLPRQEAMALTRPDERWRVHLRGGALEADAVIVALPAPQAARLFRPTAPQMTTLLNHFPHAHGAKVFLVYRGAEVPPGGPRELFPAAGEGFGGVSLEVTRPAEGTALARVQFAGEAARGADAELTRLAQQDLATLWQTSPRPLAAWAFRQPSARPQFTLGHARRVDAVERELVHAPGLFLAGGYLAGPGLARLVDFAHKVANRALDFVALTTPAEAPRPSQ